MLRKRKSEILSEAEVEEDRSFNSEERERDRDAQTDGQDKNIEEREESRKIVKH